MDNGKLSALEGSSLHEALTDIFSFYDSIECDFAPFEREFGISCPPRCGKCCERFIPDITWHEALAIAFRLVVEEGRDVSFMKGWRDKSSSCPLYDPVSKRCSAYSARPVICRVFGSAASGCKEGLSFRGCRLSVDRSTMPAELKDGELSRAKCRVPVMGHYGEAVRNLPGAAPGTKLMDEAVPEAAERILYAISLISGRGGMAG